MTPPGSRLEDRLQAIIKTSPPWTQVSRSLMQEFLKQVEVTVHVLQMPSKVSKLALDPKVILLHLIAQHLAVGEVGLA